VIPSLPEPHPDRLEGSPTFLRLAPCATRLVTMPHHRGYGRQQRGRQPVADTRPRGRCGGAPSPTATRRSTSPGCRAAGLHARPLAPRRRHLWLSRAGLDLRTDCRAHAAGVCLTYHPSHVGRLLKARRWSLQQPARRARQRDEAAMARWRQEPWPALKRGRRPRAKASCSSTHRGSLPCPVWSAPMRR